MKRLTFGILWSILVLLFSTSARGAESYSIKVETPKSSLSYEERIRLYDVAKLGKIVEWQNLHRWAWKPIESPVDTGPIRPPGHPELVQIEKESTVELLTDGEIRTDDIGCREWSLVQKKYVWIARGWSIDLDLHEVRLPLYLSDEEQAIRQQAGERRIPDTVFVNTIRLALFDINTDNLLVIKAIGTKPADILANPTRNNETVLARKIRRDVHNATVYRLDEPIYARRIVAEVTSDERGDKYIGENPKKSIGISELQVYADKGLANSKYLLSIDYLSQGQLDRAKIAALSAIHEYPYDPRYYTQYARLLELDENYDTAILQQAKAIHYATGESFSKIQEMAWTLENLYYRLAILNQKDNTLQDATHAITSAIKTNPFVPKFYDGAADILLNVHEQEQDDEYFARAVRRTIKAISLDPENLEIYMRPYETSQERLSRFHGILKADIEKVETDVFLYEDYDRTNWYNWYLISGYISFLQRDYQRAWESFRNCSKAIRGNMVKERAVNYYLGYVALRSGEYREGIETVRKHIKNLEEKNETMGPEKENPENRIRQRIEKSKDLRGELYLKLEEMIASLEPQIGFGQVDPFHWDNVQRFVEASQNKPNFVENISRLLKLYDANPEASMNCASQKAKLNVILAFTNEIEIRNVVPEKELEDFPDFDPRNPPPYWDKIINGFAEDLGRLYEQENLRLKTLIDDGLSAINNIDWSIDFEDKDEVTTTARSLKAKLYYRAADYYLATDEKNEACQYSRDSVDILKQLEQNVYVSEQVIELREWAKLKAKVLCKVDDQVGETE